MAIDYNRFLTWVESRFDPGDIKLGKNGEIRLRSIFHPDKNDRKFRLWCSPSGGKKDRQNGVYHCFDTDQKGSLIKFVTIVDNCTYEEANELLGGQNATLDKLEKLAAEVMFGKKEEKKVVAEKSKKLELPVHTYAFCDLPSNNYHRMQAEIYLHGRSLPTDDFMICVRGEYQNRIIIPYYDKEGELVYYNGRYIGSSKKVGKYKFPDKDIVDRATVLYFPKWPDKGSKIYIAEGEFDSYSIFASGLNSAGFGGKYLAETQMEILRPYIPVLCLDSDTAGGDALPVIGDSLMERGFKEIHYVRPPKGVKDWNEFLHKLGPNVLKSYIENKSKPYSSWTSTALGFDKL